MPTQVLSAQFLENYGKNWSVGIGSFAVVIDGNGSNRDEFGGLGLSTTFTFNDNFAIQAQHYSLENDVENDIEISGYEASAYVGNNLKSEGFKTYGGVGFYSEKMEYRRFSESFTGAHLSGGLGYNWERLSLDFTLSLRTVGDYADFSDEEREDITALSGALIAAFRF